MSDELLRQARKSQRLTDLLVAVEIPVETVRCVGGVHEIVYAAEATDEQRLAGEAILSGFDVSDEAQDLWQLMQSRNAALGSLLSRPDETGIQVRIVVDAICTLANNEFEALGRGRPLVAQNILAYIMANPTSGDPQST